MVRVLAISGSLRPGSHNRRLLELAARLAPAGTTFEVWAGLEEIPAYREHIDGQRPPGAVVGLREATAQADALLIATPEYNASIPGALKNALDWASRPFPDNSLRGKPAAVIGASTGLFGAVWAQAETRKVLGTAGARPLEVELPIGQADEALGEDGGLRDPELTDRLIAVLNELTAAAVSRRDLAT